MQALCKHCASYVQARVIYVQARLLRIARTMCFCYFGLSKAPPKHPYYNIKKGECKRKVGPQRNLGAGRGCDVEFHHALVVLFRILPSLEYGPTKS